MLKISRRQNAIHVACSAWLLLALTALPGCQSGDTDDKVVVKEEKKTVPIKPAVEKKKITRKVIKKKTPRNKQHTSKPKINRYKGSPPGTLADLLDQDDNQPAFGTAAAQKKLQIDPQRVASKGIRKLTGKHLTLYTDLPADKEVDQLPKIFDLAVPQWCEYFKIDPKKVEQWHMTGFLIKEKERFQAAGLMPDFLPPFLFGYHFGHELWAYEQPSAYYRRHLLLHEGTHAFMAWHLGGSGPPWYSEGMAELMGTHRWQDGRLTLSYFPKNREEASHWGRVKIIRDEFQAQRGKTLLEVMQYGPRAHLQNEPYAWCWAATTFLDNHPDYREAFRQLRSQSGDRTNDFSSAFYQKLKADWPKIAEQWQLFVVEMDYGYDVAKAAVDYKPGSPLPPNGADVTIRADRGWQSTGIRLEAGKTYNITAAGRYQVGKLPKPWWCEPGGVTIRYYRGQPLGMLMGAVRADDGSGEKITRLALPQPIGLSRQISMKQSGTLYLRINEFSGALADNSGEVKVHVESP